MSVSDNLVYHYPPVFVEQFGWTPSWRRGRRRYITSVITWWWAHTVCTPALACTLSGLCRRRARGRVISREATGRQVRVERWVVCAARAALCAGRTRGPHDRC